MHTWHLFPAGIFLFYGTIFVVLTFAPSRFPENMKFGRPRALTVLFSVSFIRWTSVPLLLANSRRTPSALVLILNKFFSVPRWSLVWPASVGGLLVFQYPCCILIGPFVLLARLSGVLDHRLLRRWFTFILRLRPRGTSFLSVLLLLILDFVLCRRVCNHEKKYRG